MLGVILRRLLQLIPVLLGIVTIVFFLQRLIPGNPADAVLGVDAALSAKEEWLAKYGFDKPIADQYVAFLGQLLRGDFGRTFANYTPVFEVIRPRLIETAKLAFTAFSFSVLFATFIGLVSAARAGKLADKAAAVVSVLAISAPSFIIGPVLMWVFSVKLDWFPLMGNDTALSYVLPAFTLGAAMAALTSRMVRGGLVDVLSEDYIRTARSKGLAPWKVLTKHALRNAFLPALTILGMQLGVLLSGAVITEQIFSWPGLGTLTVEAVQTREYNLVSGCVLVMATIYVVCNFVVDLLYRVLDPRVRVG
ncbi:MAG: ABC transporter permease [Silvanigrellales bacterium]|nr:ABC transporter permease [Silvanigrellales bacterium]